MPEKVCPICGMDQCLCKVFDNVDKLQLTTLPRGYKVASWEIYEYLDKEKGYIYWGVKCKIEPDIGP